MASQLLADIDADTAKTIVTVVVVGVAALILYRVVSNKINGVTSNLLGPQAGQSWTNYFFPFLDTGNTGVNSDMGGNNFGTSGSGW
jgi:hypothetical protein